ncbi:hypothetical protein K501DRAFT_212747 [Backusella circina FSU 941]|nr:hypothetical protein K501DRAFT_212747 [Backusella circina FSU 941]
METQENIFDSIASVIPTLITYLSLYIIFVPASKSYFYDLVLSFQNIVYKIAWHTCRYFIRSLTTLVSLKLSPIQQMAFEEQFKYLIVTSTLLNDSQITPQPKMELEKTFEQPKVYDTRNIKAIGIVFYSIMGLCVMTVPRTNKQREMALYLLSTAFIVSCYFVYRYERHGYARHIHAAALESMQQFISLSQESDTLINKLIEYFINKDEALATPLFKSKLKAHCESYSTFVEQLKPLTDLNEIVGLGKMYNIRDDIPSSLLDSLKQNKETLDIDLLKNDDMRAIYSVISWMRRQYLIYFMGMGTMSKSHSSHYGENWEYAIKINNALIHECSSLNKDLLDISSCLACDTPTSRQNSSDVTSDTRIIGLMHRLLAFEKHMKDVQAHLYLSKQDAKLLSSGRVKAYPVEKIAARFNKIDDLLPQLLNQWQESKAAFMELDEQSKLKINSPLPSPPTSPLYISSPELLG